MIEYKTTIHTDSIEFTSEIEAPDKDSALAIARQAMWYLFKAAQPTTTVMRTIGPERFEDCFGYARQDDSRISITAKISATSRELALARYKTLLGRIFRAQLLCRVIDHDYLHSRFMFCYQFGRNRFLCTGYNTGKGWFGVDH